ncbi:MAG TPA: hypothetical protein VEM13_13055 [Gemmatimonadales bacterium]|nr:hypothetical protein [Gemmatimonadales bacterium]
MRRASPILSAVAVLAACTTPPTASNIVRVTGAVHYYTFEGGFWAVGGDNGTTYDPVGALPADFQHEGLRVRLEARLRPDVISLHMAGPIVDIISIQPL